MPLRGPIKTRDDLEEKFKIPGKPTGYFKKYVEILNAINGRIGDRVFLFGGFLGPISIACYMRGVEHFLLDTKRNLDLLKKVCDLVLKGHGLYPQIY